MLLAYWLEAQLPPIYFEEGVQIHEKSPSLNKKKESAFFEDEL